MRDDSFWADDSDEEVAWTPDARARARELLMRAVRLAIEPGRALARDLDGGELAVAALSSLAMTANAGRAANRYAAMGTRIVVDVMEDPRAVMPVSLEVALTALDQEHPEVLDAVRGELLSVLAHAARLMVALTERQGVAIDEVLDELEQTFGATHPLLEQDPLHVLQAFAQHAAVASSHVEDVCIGDGDETAFEDIVGDVADELMTPLALFITALPPSPAAGPADPDRAA